MAQPAVWRWGAVLLTCGMGCMHGSWLQQVNEHPFPPLSALKACIPVPCDGYFLFQELSLLEGGELDLAGPELLMRALELGAAAGQLAQSLLLAATQLLQL